ncbi:Plasmodium exported protein (PHISTb), unknown function [Plasmodium sp. gorilla clade G3]|nr:Plasmodium exported protein (PHISTb), unknown function [Plasmodium sp. gorilla clade G3]
MCIKYINNIKIMKNINEHNVFSNRRHYRKCNENINNSLNVKCDIWENEELKGNKFPRFLVSYFYFLSIVGIIYCLLFNIHTHENKYEGVVTIWSIDSRCLSEGYNNLYSPLANSNANFNFREILHGSNHHIPKEFMEWDDEEEKNPFKIDYDVDDEDDEDDVEDEEEEKEYFNDDDNFNLEEDMAKINHKNVPNKTKMKKPNNINKASDNKNNQNKNNHNKNNHNKNNPNKNDHNKNNHNKNDHNKNNHNKNNHNKNDHNKNDHNKNDHNKNDPNKNKVQQEEKNKNNTNQKNDTNNKSDENKKKVEEEEKHKKQNHSNEKGNNDDNKNKRQEKNENEGNNKGLPAYKRIDYNNLSLQISLEDFEEILNSLDSLLSAKEMLNLWNQLRGIERLLFEDTLSDLFTLYYDLLETYNLTDEETHDIWKTCLYDAEESQSHAEIQSNIDYAHFIKKKKLTQESYKNYLTENRQNFSKLRDEINNNGETYLKQKLSEYSKIKNNKLDQENKKKKKEEENERKRKEKEEEKERKEKEKEEEKERKKKEKEEEKERKKKKK